jgi:transcription termination/antitermination protein NusA
MSNLDMSEAIRLLAQEKGLSEDALLHVLVDALASAYKRRPGAADEVVVEVNPQSMEFTFTAFDLDEDGNWVNERDDTPRKEELGRIAAQTFRQVMSQRIREVERDRKFEEYANREGDIVTGIIQQTDSRYTLLDLGRVEALLPQAEQVPYERPAPNTRLKAYIVEVRRTAKGPQIVVSRTHPGLILELFKLEVPEIADGIVEIKACAREPGHRTKIAVWSNDANVDPVGACVGARGARVRQVVNELNGEKIDIVPFSDDAYEFVMKALSPAKVKEVRIDPDTGTATVIVPDFQLSLAIGKEGQNARLAARLTGWRVDIKSETQIAEEEAYAGEEWAEGQWVVDEATGEQVWQPAEGGPALSAEEWAAAVDEGAEGSTEGDAGEAAEAGETAETGDAADDGAGDDGPDDGDGESEEVESDLVPSAEQAAELEDVIDPPGADGADAGEADLLRMVSDAEAVPLEETALHETSEEEE